VHALQAQSPEFKAQSHKKKKIDKETSELSNTVDQMDLTDIYRIFHPTVTEYTFFLKNPQSFFQIDSILGHKAIKQVFFCFFNSGPHAC
jgi:exonuclease III